MVWFEKGSSLAEPLQELLAVTHREDCKEDVKRGELSVREIQNAEVEVIKYMQRLFFPRELNALMTEAQQRRSISRVSGKRRR